MAALAVLGAGAWGTALAAAPVTSSVRRSPSDFFSIQVSAPAWSRTFTQASRLTMTSSG